MLITATSGNHARLYLIPLTHYLSLSFCLSGCLLSFCHDLSLSVSHYCLPPSPICLFTAFSNVAWVHSSKSVTLTKRPLAISNVTPKYLQSRSKRWILWWRSENQVEMGERYWLKGSHSVDSSTLCELLCLLGKTALKKKKPPQCSGGK